MHDPYGGEKKEKREGGGEGGPARCGRIVMCKHGDKLLSHTLSFFLAVGKQKNVRVRVDRNFILSLRCDIRAYMNNTQSCV